MARFQWKTVATVSDSRKALVFRAKRGVNGYDTFFYIFFYIFVFAMLGGIHASLAGIQKSLSKIEKHLESQTQKEQTKE